MADTTSNIIVPDPTFAALNAALPAAGGTYSDDAFSETVKRITDVATEDATKNFIVPEYSSSRLANVDGTLLRLTRSSGGYRLYSLPNFTFIRNINPSATSQSDFWWDYADPDILWSAMYGGAPPNFPPGINKYNYATNSNSTHVDFNSLDSDIVYCAGRGENAISDDGNRIALCGGGPACNDYLFVYQWSTNTIIAKLDIAAENPIDGVTVTQVKDIRISPDGTVVACSFNSTNHFMLFDINVGAGTLDHFSTPSANIGHKDFGVDSLGVGYALAVESSITNQLYRINLNTGATQGIRTGTFPGWDSPPYTNMGLYTSCGSMADDDYVYVCLYDAITNVQPAGNWGPRAAEIMRMKHDQSGDIERYCHHRAAGKDSGGTDYWMIPKMTFIECSDGSQWVLFASDLQAGVDNYADTWAVQIASAGSTTAGEATLDTAGTLSCEATKTASGSAALSGGGTLASAGSKTPGPSTPVGTGPTSTSMSKTAAM